jgi:hypothetical protein
MQRALDAHREGKLLVVLDPDAVESITVDPGRAAEINVSHNGLQALAEAIQDARQFAATAHPEVVEDESPDGIIADAFPEEDPITITTLHESDTLRVYVRSDYEEGQWQLGGGISPGSQRVGGFTANALREAMAEGYKKLTVSKDLMPNAMAVLIAIGAIDEVVNRNISDWIAEVEAGDKPFTNHEPNASERIVFAIRDCLKAVEGELKDAHAESFPQPYRYMPGMLKPNAALSNAYERLIEALMWADRHEEKVARVSFVRRDTGAPAGQ